MSWSAQTEQQLKEINASKKIYESCERGFEACPFKPTIDRVMQIVEELTAIQHHWPMYMHWDQLLRASSSIAANMAEGYGRDTPLEILRFMKIARGSAYECGVWGRLLPFKSSNPSLLAQVIGLPELVDKTICDYIEKSMESLGKKSSL